MMPLRALLAALITCATTAARADQPLEADPPQLITAPPPATSTLADKTAVMSGEWVTSGRRPAPVFGLDLMFGQQIGIRPSLAVYSVARSSFLVEGFYGELLSKFGASETVGAGVRWMITSGGSLNSVTFGPGVDVLFHLDSGKAVILAPTVDVAWRHKIGERAAFVFGLNAGVGIGLSGTRGNDDLLFVGPIVGRLTPLISLYTGFRF